MKLQYINLKNFALLQSGMKIPEIELDFRKTNNVINLIIGNNGTGKTGLLSNLHPFATLGHLEARDDADLIIPGENGYKHAIFTTKKHEYDIEHHYQWMGENRSRKLASYIKKDGQELNPPGTVSGFLDVVSREFDIDVNFLKLIRLGGNVRNFVELSSAERIAFIGKLLAAVEMYSKANKIMRERSNALSSILKNTVNKLNELGITDVSVLDYQVETKQKVLVDLRKELETEIAEYNQFKGRAYDPRFDFINSDCDNLMIQIKNIKTELSSMKAPRYQHISTGDNLVDFYNEKISKYQDKQLEIKANISECLSDMKVLDEKIKKLESSVDKTLTKIQKESILESIKTTEKKLRTFEVDGIPTDPGLSVDELKNDLDKINLIMFHYDNIVKNTSSFGLTAFLDLYDKWKGDLNEIDSECADKITELNRMLNASGDNKIRIMYVPSACECADKCPYYKYYKNNVSPDIDRESIEVELEAYENVIAVCGEIYAINQIIGMRNMAMNLRFPIGDGIINALTFNDKNRIVDFKGMNDLIDKCTRYKEYQELQTRLEEYNKILENSSTEGLSKEEITDQIRELKEDYGDMNDELDNLREKLPELSKQVERYRDMLSDYIYQIEYNSKVERLNSEMNQKSKDLSELYIIKQMKDDFDKRSQEFELRTDHINKQIKDAEQFLLDVQMKKKLYYKLQEDIAEIEKRYDYVNEIKEATSQSDGIPLIHIQLYCKALCTIANNIIKSIYGGDFYIKKFDVREGVFDIPYYSKGFSVGDIRKASQAEASVAKLAISFAILSQFMSKYNIPLLDEVDGPMHQVNKEKFFSSVEGILKDTLKCEQVFMITQSPIAVDYPVNFIVTDSEYSHLLPNNASVIFQR